MARTIILLTLLGGLAACGEYEGRQTNCWSGGFLGFAAASEASSSCSEWIDVNG